MDSFNIVLIGENFPVSSIDMGDFDFLGRPVRERVRLPVLLEMQAGEFAMTVLPERFQVGVTDTRDTEDKLQAVSSGAVTFLEYAGRRTITAVGHNFQVVLGVGRSVESLAPLVAYDTVQALVGSDEVPAVDLEVGFLRGQESTARMKVVTKGRPDSVLLDFNFHYAIGKSERFQDAAQAINRFTESYAIALELADRFPALIGVGERA